MTRETLTRPEDAPVAIIVFVMPDMVKVAEDDRVVC